MYAFAGDRLVMRDWPARHTLAGGVVLDPARSGAGSIPTPAGPSSSRGPPRAARPAGVRRDAVGARDGAVTVKSLLTQSRFGREEIARAASELAQGGRAVLAGGVLIDAQRWIVLRNKAVEAIDAEHKARPQEPGLKLVELRKAIEPDLPAADVFDALLADLCRAEFVKSGAVIHRPSTARPSRHTWPPRVHGCARHWRPSPSSRRAARNSPAIPSRCRPSASC